VFRQLDRRLLTEGVKQVTHYCLPSGRARWRAVSEGTYPVVRQLTHWIHLGEEGSLGLTHDGENDRSMALPQLRI